MKNKKIISDIRFYESNIKNITGNSLPSGIYNKSLNIATHRVAMKLRENDFTLSDFDHLYVNLTTCEVSIAVV